MEVKEIVKMEDPNTGRILNVHVTEGELQEIVQVGLFVMLRQGHISFKDMIEQTVADEEVPEGTAVN